MVLTLNCFLLLFLLCFSTSLHTAFPLNSDGKTLLSLLNHWTTIPSSIQLSWNSSDSNPCSWAGIQCHKKTQFVASLNLSSFAISGQLGPEIGFLDHLEYIDFNNNNFSGSIPFQLGNCTSLQYLDLSENSFTGQIPKTLGDLKLFEYVNIYGNYLSGEIPQSLFSSPHLTTVYLNDNQLTGTIPSNIGNSSKLMYLWLYNNQLSGTIPYSLGNCSVLQEVYLNENNLVGTLPSSLDNLQHLVYFDVSDNNLEGNFPFSLGNCKEMDTLVLSGNNITGTIPSALGNCSSLTTLAAVSCALSGSIPSSFGELIELKVLYLTANNLSGTIPKELGKCTSLVDLRLEENNLEGEIPVEFGMLTQLENLFLFTNKLSGEIPLGVWKIKTLVNLMVYQNNLFGEMPDVVTELQQLKNLSLMENNFSGTIPQGLGLNSSLILLDLTSNRFTGPIPPNLCFGNNLRKLTLGKNYLQGGIPADVGTCSNLTRLILKNNNLTGFIPDFVYNPNMLFMDLSNNSLNGSLPASLSNLPSVFSIDLSVNNLSGPIPPELSKLRGLQALNLSHNALKGEVPSVLSNCDKLMLFDVSYNFLVGLIPSTLKSMTELSTLGLSDNGFTGDIPPFLFELSKLSSLRLGGNLFGGSIPSAIGSLKNLRSLNLSHNRLISDVPNELGSIMLEILDLSCNNLSGSLRAFDNVHSLLSINVSYNLFSGPVPRTLLGFLDSSPNSFAGTSGLCITDNMTYSLSSSLRPCGFQPRDKKTDFRKVIAMIVLGTLLIIVFLVLAYKFFRKRVSETNVIVAEEGGSSLLTEVMEATENLDDKYIIGRGAHGTVYKAILRQNKEYAVKKLPFVGINTNNRSMLREIQTIGMVRHRNLVKLEEFWFRKSYGLILYRYMSNGSLHDVLHVNDPPQHLEWNVRYNIALGTAHGLAYLHFDCNPAIVHRDIKPMNILLDSDMEPHISDFGIAKLLEHSNASLASSTIVGTTGYIAPENAFKTSTSKESDVYSYGVVLLELITRKKALDPSFNEDQDIVNWAQSVWRKTERIQCLVDQAIIDELLDSSVLESITNVLSVALRCTEKNPNERPTMIDVVKELVDASPMSIIKYSYNRVSSLEPMLR